MANVHKVILLGDIGVGKTSIARRLIFQRFEHNYKATIGVDVYVHNLVIDHVLGPSVNVKQLIWDIDGDFGQSVFSQIYTKGATAALIIGDCSRAATRDSVVTLAQAFQELFPGRPIALVANKTDLVPDNDLATLIDSLSILRLPVFKTSAKTGENIQECFEWVSIFAYEHEL